MTNKKHFRLHGLNRAFPVMRVLALRRITI